MSSAAAKLFSRLQKAEFYRKLHVDALSLAGERQGGNWLDIGCGPGLWAALAAAAGYGATGIDRDGDMIAAARHRHADSPARFEVGDIASTLAAEKRFDIVSASSLVVVTPQPAATLRQLLQLLAPGGVLLLIEASPAMSRAKALAMILSGSIGSGAMMLQAWAMARSGSALPDSLFYDEGWTTTKHPMLAGMVNARSLSPHPASAG